MPLSFCRNRGADEAAEKLAELIERAQEREKASKKELENQKHHVARNKIGLRLVIKQLASVDSREQTYRAIGFIDVDWKPRTQDYEAYLKLDHAVKQERHFKRVQSKLDKKALESKEEEDEEEDELEEDEEEEEDDKKDGDKKDGDKKKVQFDDKETAPTAEEIEDAHTKLAEFTPSMVPEITFSNMLDVNEWEDVLWGNHYKFKLRKERRKKQEKTPRKYWVRRIKFDVVFCEPFQVKNFPFDVQDLVFVMEAMDMPKNEILKLVPSRVHKETFEIETTYMSVPDWEVKNIDVFVAKLDWDMIETFSKSDSLSDGQRKIIEQRHEELKQLVESKKRNRMSNQPKSKSATKEEQHMMLMLKEEKPEHRKKKEKKELKARDVDKKSRMYFRLQARRLFENILYRVVLWMALLGLLSFAIYAIEPADIASRLGFAVTMNLAVVTFQFVLSNMVPGVPYLTLIDKYNLAIYAMVLLQSLFAVFTGIRGSMFNTDFQTNLDTAVFYIMFALFVGFHVFVYYYAKEQIGLELSRIGLSKNYIDLLNKLEGYSTEVGNGLVELLAFNRAEYKAKKEKLKTY